MMRKLNITGLLLLPFLCVGVAALHDESETSICRRESGEAETTLDIRKIISTCFGHAFSSTIPNIRICDDQGRLHCNAIKSVFSIIPSCHYCDLLSSDKEQCYVRQKQQTTCSINHFLSKINCIKVKGQCQKKFFSTSTRTLNDVTTVEQTTFDGGIETTMATSYAGEDSTGNKGFYNYDKKECKPCEDCSQSERQVGVPVGVAIGLLFVGLAIGTIVTAFICFCAHSKRNSSNEKSTEKNITQNSQDKTSRPHHENGTLPVSDNTLPVETTINYPLQPTAPIRSGSSQAGYHTLGTVSNSRDSHTYTGLQADSPEYQEPIGDDGKYHTPNVQPTKGSNTVISPVYNEFTDNIIPSKGGKASSDNLNTNNTNQPIRNSDTNNSANHDYFVLEDQNEAGNGDAYGNRPVSDHQYYVLEEHNGEHNSDKKDKSDPEYHQYFVLEKGEA